MGRRALGNFGEAAAVALLSRNGMQIVARQWRCAAGELDIVARDGEMLVFVEVRTRRGAGSGTAEASVTATKQARLIALAYTYLEAHNLPDSTLWRIDVVAVDVGPGGTIARCAHLPYAVEES